MGFVFCPEPANRFVGECPEFFYLTNAPFGQFPDAQLVDDICWVEGVIGGDGVVLFIHPGMSPKCGVEDGVRRCLPPPFIVALLPAPVVGPTEMVGVSDILVPVVPPDIKTRDEGSGGLPPA